MLRKDYVLSEHFLLILFFHVNRNRSVVGNKFTVRSPYQVSSHRGIKIGYYVGVVIAKSVKLENMEVFGIVRVLLILVALVEVPAAVGLIGQWFVSEHIPDFPAVLGYHVRYHAAVAVWLIPFDQFLNLFFYKVFFTLFKEIHLQNLLKKLLTLYYLKYATPLSNIF